MTSVLLFVFGREGHSQSGQRCFPIIRRVPPTYQEQLIKIVCILFQILHTYTVTSVRVRWSLHPRGCDVFVTSAPAGRLHTFTTTPHTHTTRHAHDTPLAGRAGARRRSRTPHSTAAGAGAGPRTKRRNHNITNQFRIIRV